MPLPLDKHVKIPLTLWHISELSKNNNNHHIVETFHTTHTPFIKKYLEYIFKIMIANELHFRFNPSLCHIYTNECLSHRQFGMFFVT